MDINERKRKYKDNNEDLSRKQQKIPDFNRELSKFLQDKFNLKNTKDFWIFYNKYEKLQQTQENNEKLKQFSIDFTHDFNDLYKKLQYFDKKLSKITRSTFKEFLVIIRIYQDFQQRLKFNKLKELREKQANLPINQYKSDILEKFHKTRVLLISGDTGCGKSTQLPQLLLKHCPEIKRIVCTQPRRIACISLAKRVSYETLTEYKKNFVGYQIRFEKTSNLNQTRILYMTEGLLLRQMNDDDVIKRYDVIILDEIHERHLQCDFLIGLMKCLLFKMEFKLILMSATINLELFKQYFINNQLEICQIPGRLYPIEIVYRPIIKDMFDSKKNNSKFDVQPYLQIIQMIDEKYDKSQKGDLLIFLNGFSEISQLTDAVEQYNESKDNWIVLQLHSSLSIEEQDKVFKPSPDGIRKCIISTNIAETSITIDGVRFVIDSGKQNLMFYHRNGVNKLQETNISQANAKQRTGRAGRTGPGICYRLYTQLEYEKFPTYTQPEIHLVPLETILLQMFNLGLENIENFPFLESPNKQLLANSLEKLQYLQAIEKIDGNLMKLTVLGQYLCELPLDLQLGKMLLSSLIFPQFSTAVLIIISLLSVQNPILQLKNNLDIEELRKPYVSLDGDHFTLLNYFKYWLELKINNENSRKWCKKLQIEEQRFYETIKLFKQFNDFLINLDLIKKIDENLTKTERILRYGELKNLREKKRIFENNDNDINSNNDMKSIEFYLKNNSKQLRHLYDNLKINNKQFIKLLIINGLYPQIAISDLYNAHNNNALEQVFHTKEKDFLFLHPSSVFALNVCCLSESDVVVPPSGYFSKLPLSSKHQLLLYGKILETKKCYLINLMCFNNCLQSLLLFGKLICCNTTLTRFLIDNYFLIDCPFNDGKLLLLHSIKIRKLWFKLCEEKLNTKNDDVNLCDDLMALIRNFLNFKINYNIKRLLPADLKLIFNYKQLNCLNMEKNPFDLDFPITPNFEFGGLNVTKYLIYGCLNDDDWSRKIEIDYFNVKFTCIKCGVFEKLNYGFFDVLQHEVFCNTDISDNKIIDNNEIVTNSKNLKLFQCENCQKTLQLTPIDVLKHKKNCK